MIRSLSCLISSSELIGLLLINALLKFCLMTLNVVISLLFNSSISSMSLSDVVIVDERRECCEKTETDE